jgi:hypothetical protein
VEQEVLTIWKKGEPTGPSFQMRTKGGSRGNDERKVNHQSWQQPRICAIPHRNGANIMRATTILVNVRYSRPLADGSYKTVELGCEATLTATDKDWREVQADLYRQLGDQMRSVFNGNGSGKATQGPEKAVEALPAPPLPPRTTQGALVPEAPDGLPEVREGRAGVVQPALRQPRGNGAKSEKQWPGGGKAKPHRAGAWRQPLSLPGEVRPM